MFNDCCHSGGALSKTGSWIKDQWDDFASYYTNYSMDDFSNDMAAFLAVIPGGAVADEVGVVAGKSVVIGENMLDRVIPAAEKLGAEYYKPAEAPASEWMANNKSWIHGVMDQGYKIFDIGAEPGRAMYPEATSDFYHMETQEISNRGYNNYERIDVDK